MLHNLTQTTRVSRSRHTGRPLREELNTCYGYWATTHFLSEQEYEAERRKPAYTGPMHPAEVRHRDAIEHSCG